MWRSRLEDVLLKRVPEGWTFDSNYPRPFARQRWTYLLTEKEKDTLALGFRMIRWILWLDVLAVFLVIAICDPNLAVHLALGWPRAWLLFFLLVLLLAGTLFLAYYLFIWRPLRTARRIGRAPHLSTIMFIADRYTVRTLIVWMIISLLVCGYGALGLLLSPLPAVDARIILVETTLVGLVAISALALLVVKLRARRQSR
jgi:hypothetical protein